MVGDEFRRMLFCLVGSVVVSIAMGADPAKRRLSDDEATRLARSMYGEIESITDLPRFFSQTRCCNEFNVELPETEPEADPLQRFETIAKRSPGCERWFDTVFAWDETQWMVGSVYSSPESTHPPKQPLAPEALHSHRLSIRWGDLDYSGHRMAIPEEATNTLRRDGPAMFDDAHFNHPTFFTITPLKFRFGRNAWASKNVASTRDPREVDYQHVGEETVRGVDCVIVAGSQRRERLWIDPETRRLHRRVRGNFDGSLIRIMTEYADHQEVSEGKFLPSRCVEVLIVGPDEHRTARRCEGQLVRLDTTTSLDPWIETLRPRIGEPVQDQRFSDTYVDIVWGETNEAEVRRLAEKKQQRLEADRRAIAKLAEPYEAMVGKPAPPLPKGSWLSGDPEITLPADLSGKPYLIHLWATWCGPCKNDVPTLNALAESGRIVIGLHPPEPIDQVRDAMTDVEMKYPTWRVNEQASGEASLGEYPATIFPYVISVTGRGVVDRVGPLRDVLGGER